MFMYNRVSWNLCQLRSDIGGINISSGWTTEQSIFVILQTSKMFNIVLVISSCKIAGDVSPFKVTGTLTII